MTEQPHAPVSSGWYDDPRDATQLRYGDGILWTERTMPKLRPGLDHVGEARPVQHVDAPPRRDGEPRTYPAHWGPEGSGEQQHRFGAPQPRAHDQRPTAFGTSAGEPSGVWRRFFAYFLDRIIFGVPVTLAMLPFLHSWIDEFRDFIDEASTAASNGGQMPAFPDDLTSPPLVLALALFVAGFVYDTLMTSLRGATLGKSALGIRVAPIEEGDPRSPQKLPMARSAVRALIKYVPDLMSLVAVLAGIAGLLQIAILLWALSNRLRQGLDDLAARSVVRRTR